MSEAGVDAIREIQRQITQDATQTLNRAELMRMRAYWGQLQTVLDNEREPGHTRE